MTVGWFEILTPLGALGSPIALVVEHCWVSRQLKRSRKKDEFYRMVETPLREELVRLSDYAADVDDWENCRESQAEQSIKSFGKRVSRRLNQAINLVAGLRLCENTAWILLVKTDNFDEALRTLCDISTENPARCYIKSLRQETESLERKLRETLEQARPK